MNQETPTGTAMLMDGAMARGIRPGSIAATIPSTPVGGTTHGIMTGMATVDGMVVLGTTVDGMTPGTTAVGMVIVDGMATMAHITIPATITVLLAQQVQTITGESTTTDLVV